MYFDIIRKNKIWLSKKPNYWLSCDQKQVKNLRLKMMSLKNNVLNPLAFYVTTYGYENAKRLKNKGKIFLLIKKLSSIYCKSKTKRNTISKITIKLNDLVTKKKHNNMQNSFSFK